MDTKLFLVKSITLLYRESQQSSFLDTSHDLIRTVLDTIKISEVGIGMRSDRDVVLGLKDTLVEMLDTPMEEGFDPCTLLQRIKVNVEGDDKLYDAVKQGIEAELQDGPLKRSILHLRKAISNHYREHQIAKIIGTASYDFSHRRDKIKDVNAYITNLIEQLEPLQVISSMKDPALVSEIDIGDEGQTSSLFKTVQEATNGYGMLKTGWQRLNEMLQGGFRRGEFCVIGALQHKYKTGFTLSLFHQIARHNQPYMLDSQKKPLLLRISFEDDLDANIQFLYQSLKYNETREHVCIKTAPTNQLSAYIKEKLQVNGYHIKMIRVDPTQWSYKHLCNKIIDFESQGYEIHVLMIDYLGMLPTTGCTNTGPMGTDIRDLFRRIRNFCGSKKITTITPHQHSTQAKELLRTGLSEDRYVCEVTEKGYWSGSKQLCQDIDLELHIHLFRHQKENYLAVQRGKHRIPTIVNEDAKYFLLKFPNKMPIPDDVGEADSGYSKLPDRVTAQDQLFTF